MQIQSSSRKPEPKRADPPKKTESAETKKTESASSEAKKTEPAPEPEAPKATAQTAREAQKRASSDTSTQQLRARIEAKQDDAPPVAAKPIAARPRRAFSVGDPTTPPPVGDPDRVTGGGAGQAGRANPYDPDDEFGYVQHETYEDYGAEAARTIGDVRDQLDAGETPSVSTDIPQTGDVMVWGPNAGNGGTTGQADEAGHMGVVESVTANADGSYTVQVSEQNWNGEDGETADGVPYRNIRLQPNGQGGLQLPEGIGFVPVDPVRVDPPVAQPGQTTNPADAGAPPLGATEIPPGLDLRYDDPDIDIDTSDGYNTCLGYIRDIPEYHDYLGTMAATNGTWNADRTWQTFDAKNIPINSQTPQEGSLMVWQQGAGDDTVGHSYGNQGHVAYVEDVQANYDDDSGELLSYTVTISEANGMAGSSTHPGARAFTVGVDENGQPQMPDGVGFHIPPGGVPQRPSTTAPNGTGGGSTAVGVRGGNGTSNTNPVPGGPVRGSNYVVQPGDYLANIAAAAGVSVDAIVRSNENLTNPDQIYVGQNLYIP